MYNYIPALLATSNGNVIAAATNSVIHQITHMTMTCIPGILTGSVANSTFYNVHCGVRLNDYNYACILDIYNSVGLVERLICCSTDILSGLWSKIPVMPSGVY